MGQAQIHSRWIWQFVNYTAKFYNRNKICYRLLIASCCVLLLISLIFWIAPFPRAKIQDIHYSQSILDQDGNIIRTYLNSDGNWLLHCSLAEISPYLVKATLAIEDNRFYQHKGIDLLAIMRAIKLNITNKRIISGASTISMQVIGLIEHRKRSFFNKIIELLHAIILELFYSKTEILQLYFQLAPYGGNIIGVKAAALKYFNKLPTELNLAESALLAGLPQSPANLRPDRYPNRAKKRRQLVLKGMLKKNYITKTEYAEANISPIVANNFPFPFLAPHFSQFVKNRDKTKANINSSLNLPLQNFASATLKKTVEKLTSNGIHNGALIAIANKTGEIKAMVGSRDFFAKDDAGQLNGCLCKRRPSSLLKPFIYALGFASGEFIPSTELTDIPANHSSFAGENEDDFFKGLVTVREALQESLNVPAIEVLHTVGYPKFYEILHKLGITTLVNNANYYGLGLALGNNVEINLLELTNAYATLARLGNYLPYTYAKANKFPQEKQVLSKEAAYLIAEILTNKKEVDRDFITDKNVKIAVQCATSNGYKDAWAIAYNSEYTIGIWLGNFSYQSARLLNGKKLAAPIAINIFAWLYKSKNLPDFEIPKNISYAKFCKSNNDLANITCPKTTKDFFINNCSKINKCTQHVAGSKNNENIKTPQILLPISGCEYICSAENKTLEVALQAKDPLNNGKLYWFINDDFFDVADEYDKIYCRLKRGKYNISCVNESGASTTVNICIK